MGIQSTVLCTSVEFHATVATVIQLRYKYT